MPVEYPNGPTLVRGVEDPKFEAEECRNILLKLSRGNVMMKFSMKRKPEQRTFSVSDHAFIIWKIKCIYFLFEVTWHAE